METTIINYIENKIISDFLKTFLKKLISSVEVNDKLLCLCILIEIKYGLLTEENYLPVFDNTVPASAIDYEKSMPIILSNYCREKTKYSTVVSLEKFKSRYSTIKNDNSIRKNRAKIDPKKIIEEKGGWTGYKQVVWVALHKDIKQIINDSKNDEFEANKACDFVGFARTYDFSRTSSPRNHYKEFVLINYSENFNECVFQPNSSNADWVYQNTLFICYDNEDGFGRTYNENGVDFAKERIHHTSHYYDDNFNAEYIGKASSDNLTRSRILDEAFARLNI